MSKFFRRLPDSDSSSSASDSEDLEEENETTQQSQDLSESRGLDLATPPVQDEASNAIAVAGPNKDLLLHALLEEKCLNDVRKEHAGRSTSEAAIIIEARNRYQALSTRLAQVGLTRPGLDEDTHQAIRQQYRDGLNVFSQAGVRPGSSTANIRPPPRRMLTGVEHNPSSLETRFDNLQLTLPTSIPLSLGPYVPQASMFGTRYRQDFEELGILGKGGYGIVYSCRHKLDGIIYAVKKVPVSEHRRQQIMIRGQQEIDALLAELRTLAQLDHPNIVRYYNGWLDYINLEAPLQGTSPGDAVAGAESTRTGSVSFGRIITETGDDHIMFEDSGLSRATTNSTASKASTNSENENENALRRTASHATRATVSDEDVESISRASESQSSIITGTDGLQFDTSAPQLAVHMQMALYPMTLTDFLSQENPHPSQTTAPPLKHCFHLAPSIRILLSILDGIAYLHHHQIVHRDLKPGNIFLAPSSDPRHSDGSVDLFLCHACRSQSKANPISLRVRIGDFGLVTALAKDGDEGESPDGSQAKTSPVGTELYRPVAEEVKGNASPALDIFAAGVVAVELLWPFGTRMERHETLSALKRGAFPACFSERIGDPAGEMQACIRDMLRPEHPCVEDLKRRLSAML
ncbi:hypothetical protein Q7P37_007196 [Cladosporium fusiforme]